MRTSTSELVRFTRRGTVTRFLTAAIATSALAFAQTTPGTTSAPAKLPPVDSAAQPVPEAVLKPTDTPATPTDPSAGWLRISGSTVNVRVKPDVNSLSMTRLDRDAIVWAVRKENGWWAISPPPEVFALIAARFVERTGGERGIVKVESGSTLRVRAGSCNVQVNPQDTDVLAKVGNGHEVRIMGEVTSGSAPDGTPERWLKIAPPEGVVAYISPEYAESISEEVARARGATKPGMTIAANPSGSPSTAAPTPSSVTPSSTTPSGTTPTVVAATPEKTDIVPASDASVPTSSPWVRRLRMIETEIEQESKKPATDQSWTRVLGELREIAGQNEDTGAAIDARKWITQVEESSRSAAATTSTTPNGVKTVGDSTTTTTIIPVTPPPGESGSSSSGSTPANTTMTSTPQMEPSRAGTSEAAAFDVEGILRPSWKIPAGQFGLRYKLCNPTNPNLVRGYAEFPFDLQVSPTQYVGKYVGVIGERYMDTDHEVPIYRAKRLTVLTPDRAVNRPRDPQ